MRINCIAACLSAIVGAASSASAAEPSSLLLGGMEVSASSSYAYLGQVSTLSDSSFGDGFVRRVWADRSEYRYEAGGQIHNVIAPGLAIAFGYQRATQAHWWSAYVGLSYRRSAISPDDRSSRVRGGLLRPQFQLEGEQTLNESWKIAGNSSYVLGQQAYWVRLRLLRDLSAGRHVGLEHIVQGDPSYRAEQSGVLLGMKLDSGIDVGLKLGMRTEQGQSSRGYIGVEIGQSF